MLWPPLLLRLVLHVLLMPWLVAAVELATELLQKSSPLLLLLMSLGFYCHSLQARLRR